MVRSIAQHSSIAKEAVLRRVLTGPYIDIVQNTVLVRLHLDVFLVVAVQPQFQHHLLNKLVLLVLAKVFLALDMALLYHLRCEVEILPHHLVPFDAFSHILMVHIVDLLLNQI